MPRRERPARTTRSEHWLREAVNSHPAVLESMMSDAFGWAEDMRIDWLSPVADDDHAEYYDQDFLERLGVSDLRVPLDDFWPASGPRWDGLGRTANGGLILVEAKAYIEESVDYGSKAKGASREKIRSSLDATKSAFGARPDSNWETPFYQYANRLAHLHFLSGLNGLDAYLVFLYFADAPDVPNPSSRDEWEGAIRLTNKCLGLTKHVYSRQIAHIIMPIEAAPSSE